MIGYLLLVIITIGATVEVAHSHAVRSPDLHGFAFVSDTDGFHTSHAGRSRHTECSMCEFQQQLFSGLVHTPLFALTSSVQLASFAAPTVAYFSTSISQPSGRAPPLA